MKVLITGANGLLGANIVRELISRGVDVQALIRKTSDLCAIKNLPIRFIEGDVLDTQNLMKALAGCNAVIHAAANTSQWPTNYNFYEPVNVTGTKNVINACRELGIEKVVYVSTANTFGHGTKENPGTELSEFNAFRYGSGYITSKFIAQQWVLSEVEKHHLPVVIVNPTFMIGPWDSKPSSGRIILMGLGKKIQPCPPGGKNFIHVKDAAVATCNALTLGVPGECYLLANENLSYREFFSKLNLIAHQKAFLPGIPKMILKIMGMGGSIYEVLSGKPSPLNYVNARLLCLENYYSGKKAAKALQMPQTSIEQAIADAMESFADNKNK